MPPDDLAERVHDLQVSLQDGDDLANAIGLIGDAMQRRLNSIRDGIDELKEDGQLVNGQRLQDIVRRVVDTLDSYEDELEERRTHIEELVQEFQESLGSEASALDDLHEDLDDE